LDNPLQVKGLWNLSRKHFRISFGDGKFVKLNRFENREPGEGNIVRVTKIPPTSTKQKMKT
jgi:hypothetical protein